MSVVKAFLAVLYCTVIPSEYNIGTNLAMITTLDTAKIMSVSKSTQICILLVSQSGIHTVYTC